jgi:hypothetical protein
MSVKAGFKVPWSEVRVRVGVRRVGVEVRRARDMG